MDANMLRTRLSLPSEGEVRELHGLLGVSVPKDVGCMTRRQGR